MASMQSRLEALFGSAWHTNSLAILLALSYTEGAVTPVSAVTPDFVGQTYFDTVTKIFYRATGTTNTDWATLANPALSATEIAFLDGALAGQAIASKAAVYGADTILSMSRAALAAAGNDATNGGAIATQVVAVTASDGTKGVVLPAASTTLGPILVINTVLTTGASLKVYPVNGGNDQINGEAEDAPFVMGPGEAAWFIPTSATQWYVSDHAGNLLTKTEINLLVGLLASAAEINRACQLSTRIVNLAVDTTITVAAHESKTIVMGGAGSSRTFTLPAATGSGARFRFVVGAVNTSNYVIKSVAGADLMEGVIFGASTTDSATDAARTWLSGATDDTITLNGTTTGGAAVGDWIEVEDISATGWAVRGMITQSGSEATPFSDTVA